MSPQLETWGGGAVAPPAPHFLRLCTTDDPLHVLNADNIIHSDPAPAEVRVVDVVNGSDSSTVTIEWTPPTTLVQYTTTTTPVPISSTMSVTTTPPTTDPIQMDIIVEYNRDYTITVSIETCAGPRQTTTTVSILRGTENDVYVLAK